MVLIATQVKRRRGTTAENDAFTGAEGEITVDTEKHELRVHDGQTQGGFVIGSGGGSGSGRNIGDIFMTKRTDTALAGAVECNGATYNTTDYEGEGSIGELLEAGKLDYISLTDYATAISTKGWCGSIGWNGTGTTSFRVPTLTPRHYIVKTQEPTAGNNYTWYRLYADGWVEQGGECSAVYTGQNVSFPIEMSNNRYHFQLSIGQGQLTGTVGTVVDSRTTTGMKVYTNYSTGQPSYICWQVSGMSNITPESGCRVMIQLFNGATDEAVATCTEVLADVADLKDLSNVTPTGKETVIGWGMPDFNSGIDKTRGTIYQAETNGWVLAYGTGNGDKPPLNLKYSLNSDLSDSVQVGGVYLANSTNMNARCLIPCPKGIYYQLNSNSSSGGIIFYPCKGEI